MGSITATEARANLYRLIDQAAASHQPLLISGKAGALWSPVFARRTPLVACG